MRAANEFPDQSGAAKLTTYEQPLNERMRTFLRLSFLFDQVDFHARGASPWQTRAAVDSLLDIMAILNRGDVRQDIAKELERHSADLKQFKTQPGVDDQRLDALLKEITKLRNSLGISGPNITQPLRESAFLNSVKHRSAIPGGTCEFDLPDYRHWLGLPAEQRARDFEVWSNALKPIRDGVDRVLWLLRESVHPTEEVAKAGMYQRVLERGVACKLLRVSLPADSDLYPEISGSAHRFTIRFQTWCDITTRPAQCTDDVAFLLSCC